MKLAPVMLLAGLVATQSITNAPTAPDRTSTPTTMITIATSVDFDMGDFALDDLADAVNLARSITFSEGGDNPITLSIGGSIVNPITLSGTFLDSILLRPRTAPAPVATQN